jgi:hypothetical protein
MFGFFKARKYSDIELGELSLEKGYWRGVIVLDPCGEIPLAIAGNKDGPDAQALAEAYRLRSNFPEWGLDIAQALLDHLEPYAQAIEAGEYPEAPERLRHIKSPSAALSSAKLQCITVDRIGGVMMTELGYDTEWDEEHTLGIRFQGGKFIELCGSILRA